MKKIIFLGILLLFLGMGAVFAQPVPAEDENIPYLVTFGKNADPSWGDDDFCQIFFFFIPTSHKTPIFIRVYDPDTGGELDEVKQAFNTKVKFSVYGGNQSFTNEAAQAQDPVPGYDSGNLLASKVFDSSPEYDEKWYTFGPFNPVEGEFVEYMKGYVFKVIAEGIAGDDGNLYRYFLSTNANENRRIEGANAFTYEYTFRLPNDPNAICHIYPFIDEQVISVMQHNFDYDSDGIVRIVSVAKRGNIVSTSGDSDWTTSTHDITKKELNTSLDIQFIKSKSKNIKNNNIAFYILNQYGQSLPFYAIPIGGVPKYEYKIGIKKTSGPQQTR